MQIRGTTAFVTGANRGIGRALVDELVARGTERVYAGVRSLDAAEPLVADHGATVVPIQIDVTNRDQIRAAAAAASDTALLVNNAGVISRLGVSALDNEDGFRQELEVNVLGPLALASALLPSIEAGDGAIVNVNSIASLFTFASAATYSATKAAAHSITQALRAELGPRGVSVLGVYPGPIDTDMAEDLDVVKASPESVAKEVLDALEKGEEDVFPDDAARQWHAQWSADRKAFEHEMATMMVG